MHASMCMLGAIASNLVGYPWRDHGFDWEEHGAARLRAWAWLWALAGMLYLPVIFGLQRVAHVFKPFQTPIRMAWFVWNLALAAFSVMGFIQVLPTYVAIWRNFDATCHYDNPAVSINGPVGQWVFYFIVSKLFEFGDTIFLCLLQKEINFLHWYHHLSIYFYCILTGLDWHHHMIGGPGTNYFVHAVMYTYYACACVNLRWPKSWAQGVTNIQILQMIINLVWTTASTIRCKANSIGHLAGQAMFTVYLVLFLDFYYKRYKHKKEERAAHQKKA